ncbi:MULTISPECIES: Eco57I restriction-modification methylase domain-containing protein [Pseudomonas]|uniref:Eco57I restriction-modification methylase domain-containing protein n=1 Tax=Pseudomonas TaxID=286 RepID=UPI0002173F53|nr:MULTISPECIES: N-6 DNA methylase [Pseudomonas]AEJ11646.1 modification methylase AccI [Pseudomonas putida S16]AHZ75872.1 modification methylase AccI [Pseudomonas putida]WOB59917.1 N-6 DNA methylase [Pseudomonas sp. NBB]
MKKQILKQYFTDAPEIKSLMCQLLGDVTNLSVLEPSVGHGSFLSGLIGSPSKIDAVDVDADALNVTRQRFGHLNLSLHHKDFIRIFDGDLLTGYDAICETLYDAVISNPPYGLYFDLDYRRQLKKRYPNFYVKESYGLFFMLSILRLKENGRYVFIVPDTFLTSVSHKPLREFIVSAAAPTHIIRFSSRRFETVNFGYGNLCIIAGDRKSLDTTGSVYWADLFDDELPLNLTSVLQSSVASKDLVRGVSTGWSSGMLVEEGRDSANHTVLGDIAECRTGIYTGDNERFIGFDPRRIPRRINGHPIPWEEVKSDKLTAAEMETGIKSGKAYVPLIRGGHRQPFEQPSSAVHWSEESVSFYKTNKKARLQNSSFYFRRGISVPMVSTSRISAALMENAVFDQGVVGIFPKEERDIPFLLIYLNSSIASRKVKEITNGSANNSANYLKRLAVPKLTEEQYRVAAEIYAKAKTDNALPQDVCDKFIESLDVLPL